MKFRFINLLLCAFLLLTSVNGQTPVYPTKIVNNIEYYVYTVEPREGFYALKRKFNISEEEVIKHNPEAAQGLKVGQQVLIPVNPALANQVQNDVKTSATRHTVEKKQTLYAISKLYNVTVDDIKNANPQIVNNDIKEGDVLLIPAKTPTLYVSSSTAPVTKTPAVSSSNNTLHIPSQAVAPPVEKRTFTHVVRPKETLFAISRLYNIYVEDIINFNPDLESPLRVGVELKIPYNSSYARDTQGRPILDIDSLFKIPTIETQKPIQIAFLLPFMLSEMNDPSIVRFMDFYAGSLIALNDAKKKGISLDIHVFDTEKSEEKVQSILGNQQLTTMDFIIGPAYSNMVSYVTDFAQANKIYTLVPFTSKIPELDTNPYLFQFNPGLTSEISFTVNQLNSKYRNANIIFVDLGSADVSDDGFVMAEELQRELTLKGRSTQTVSWLDSSTLGIGGALQKGKNNIIIFKTDKFSKVKSYIATLALERDNYDLTLFSQYSWSVQPIGLKSIYVSPFSNNLNNNLLNNFQKSFSEFFDWEVSISTPRYDLLGYDLCTYFIQLLNQRKDNPEKELTPFYFLKGVQSELKFERSAPFSGFINQRLYLTEANAQ